MWSWLPQSNASSLVCWYLRFLIWANICDLHSDPYYKRIVFCITVIATRTMFILLQNVFALLILHISSYNLIYIITRNTYNFNITRMPLAFSGHCNMYSVTTALPVWFWSGTFVCGYTQHISLIALLLLLVSLDFFCHVNVKMS